VIWIDFLGKKKTSPGLEFPQAGRAGHDHSNDIEKRYSALRIEINGRAALANVAGMGSTWSTSEGGPSVASITPYETSAGKRYRVRYRKPDHSQTDKRGFRTKREAELFLASVEVAKHTGRYIDPSRSRVTIGAWMTAWIDSRSDLRASTLDRVQGVIRNHIVPGLGTIAIADLGRLQAQQWASKLSATQSPGSVRKIVNVLSAGMQLAVDDGRIPSNPASRLKLPKQIKSHKKFLTHEQVAALAAAVEAKPSGEGFGLLILVLAYTGLRWGELSGLRVRDLDFVRGRLEVRSTMIEVNGYLEESIPKNYEARSIPVPAFILDQLAEHVASKGGDEHVFVSSKAGAVLRNRTFRRGWFNDAAASIGIPGLTPHELRHTCASLAVSAGANVKALQRMLGHSSAKETLDTYSDLFDDDLDSVAVALNDRGAALGVGKVWAKRPAKGRAAAAISTKPKPDQHFSRSPLTDSNRRPPLYKSGALAN
jgi:integrase